MVFIVSDTEFLPRVDNVRWTSLDFKTILTWTPATTDDLYTVQYSQSDNDWRKIPDCINIPEPECDLTNYLMYTDRNFSADIIMESAGMDYVPEDLPHTFSPHFNPYKQSEISAPSFSVEPADDGRIILNITDPLTPFHRRGNQLTIRDVFTNRLKYKIYYYKAGSTGKRDSYADTSIAELPQLDAGEHYCFMVAAFIPSRPEAFQLGAWSQQQCMVGHRGSLTGLSLGVLVGGLFILLVIIIIVTVLCYRCCKRRRNKSLQTSTVV